MMKNKTKMNLSDYCECAKNAKLTPEEVKALVQEIKRISAMKPKVENQGALRELIEAVEKEGYRRSI